MNITLWLAIRGAFLSTFLLGWTIYRDLSERGKIRVLC